MNYTLRITEIFESIQGEGYWAGTPATFVRFTGCPVQCDFCDSTNSWYVGISLEISEILRYIELSRLVITGGEPFHQPEGLSSLLRAWGEIWGEIPGRLVEIETSGTLPWPKGAPFTPETWVTVSPKSKSNWKTDPSITEKASAWKYVVAPDFYPGLVIPTDRPVFLQPLWGDSESLARTLGLLKENPQWRLSLQTHKYLNLR